MATHPEALLISAVLRSEDYLSAMSKGITSELFHAYKPEWQWIERFHVKHRKLPSKSTFKLKFPDCPIKTVDDVDHYVEEVKKAHAQFLLQDAMNEALGMVERGEIDGAVLGLSSKLNSIQSSTAGESATFDLVGDWKTIYDDVDARVRRCQEKGMAGIPTGFTTLDDLTGGPQPGDYWVIAARLGMGKTWTMVRMATGAISAGYKVQYDALEQSSNQVGFRFQSFLSSRYGKEVFSSIDLMRGSGFNLLSYKKFLKQLSEDVSLQGKLLISDTSRGRISPTTIAAQIERHQPSVVFVDYLTLVEQNGEDWRAIDKLSKDIKSMASRYEVPIVVAAQINRAGDGKEPPKAVHLSGADAIGQDADALVTMAQQSRHVVKFRLAKYRHGPDGDIWFTDFSPSSGKFEEVTGDRAQEIIDQDKADD